MEVNMYKEIYQAAFKNELIKIAGNISENNG